jgi:hypothetical protein
MSGEKVEETNEEIVEEVNDDEVSDEKDLQDETSESEEELEEKSETQEEDEIEQWMDSEDDIEQTDVNDAESNQSVPLRKFVSTKHKLKGKLSEKNEEIEKLQKKLELLEQNSVREAPKEIAIPKLKDYAYDEDKYKQALDDYISWKTQKTVEDAFSKNNQQTTINKLYEQQKADVDEHYERASKLVKKAKIKAEDYKKADTMVRSTLDAVSPGKGDFITDTFITALGEGSEKVMYYLGRNESARNKIQKLMVNDPTGLKAIAYLGRKLASIQKPIKLKTQASSPGKKVKGDSISNVSISSLHKLYKKSHKKGDAQKAFDAKRKAKAAGVDVSSW